MPTLLQCCVTGAIARLAAARESSNKQLILASERFFEANCRIARVSEAVAARVLAWAFAIFSGERHLRLIGYTSIRILPDLAR
jgi:hypothetical protein